MSLPPPQPIPLQLPLPSTAAAAPPPFSLYHTKQIYYDNQFYFVPPLPFLDSIFDLATLSLIAAILLLSLLSICFIFHLRFKTRTSPLLSHFNTLWTVRLLLVFLIISWALNELLRLPFFRRRYLYPFLPSLTSSQQTNFCKIQVVLSLGFFEPGFLVILLFLVKVSIKKRNSYNKWSFAAFFAASCFPLLLLQAFAVLFVPAEEKFHLRPMFQQCWIILKDEFDGGRETVFCTYPLLSTIVFAAFGVAYSLGFLISCWKVVSVVINKGLRVRIYTLACTVLISLSLQIIFLGLSVLWKPEETRAYGGVCLVIFLTVLSCAAVGEGILVISPIADTLSAGGDCCRLSSGDRSPPEVGRKLVVNGGGL